MLCIALCVECCDDRTVLVCDLHLSCRYLGMTACKMTLGGKHITQFGRYMIIYGGVDGKSHVLALVDKSCEYQIGKSEKRSALAGDYFMLSLDLPSVLVECGFLSNPEEEKLLLTPAYQQRVAKAIHDGVTAYFSLPDQGKAE